MLNASFRNNLILKFKAFATNSHSIQQLQKEQPDSFIVNLTLFRFSSQLHTQIDMTSLCEHHSLII